MATYQTMQRELFAAIEGRSIEAASPLIATGKMAQLANGFLYDEGDDDPVDVHRSRSTGCASWSRASTASRS